MTEKEIDAMEAGREMDALIAEKVFGHRVEGYHVEWRSVSNEPSGPQPWKLRHYSTDIAAAWQVVEKLRELGFWCQMNTPWINDGSPADKYWAGFTPHQTTGFNGRPDYWEEGDTLPLAVCRAALKVVPIRKAR